MTSNQISPVIDSLKLIIMSEKSINTEIQGLINL